VVRRGGRDQVVAAGLLTTPVTQDLPTRLAMLDRDLRALIAEMAALASPEARPAAPGARGQYLAVAVERVFFQVNARTAMSVGQASGLALAAAAGAGCDVVQYTPNEVKSAVAGYGSAPKDQVGRMVASLLGLAAPPRPADTADALAVALCHLAMAPLRSRTSGARAAGARS